MKSKEEAGKKPTFKPPEKMRKLARQAGFDFQRERPDGSTYKLAELARERADGGRERRQRERAPTEGDSIGEGRECWRRSGVRDSERERVDEL